MVKVLFFLCHFWPRIQTVKVFVFSWSFFLFFLCHFWPRIQTVKVFVFSWSFLVKVTKGKSFLFWAFLAKDTNGDSFVFSWSFLAPRLPTVKAFDLWAFLAKDANGESFCIFGQGYQRWKFLFFHGHFWPRLLLLATSAMNTNDESYVCDLRFWPTSVIQLCQTRVRIFWRQSLAPHCASRSSRTGRQLLAWDCKYEYTRTLVGKRWHASTSILYPRMERINTLDCDLIPEFSCRLKPDYFSKLVDSEMSVRINSD